MHKPGTYHHPYPHTLDVKEAELELYQNELQLELELDGFPRRGNPSANILDTLNNYIQMFLIFNIPWLDEQLYTFQYLTHPVTGE